MSDAGVVLGGKTVFVVLSIGHRLTDEVRKYYAHPRCAECHADIVDSDALIVQAMTVKSRSELTLFIHGACYSSKVLAGEVA